MRTIALWMLGLLCMTFSAANAGAQTAADPATSVQQLRVDDDRTSLTVRTHQGVLLRYRYGGDIFKPYVAELHLPDGRNILRDSPPDHKHHHALMFAWNVDNVEFWGEEGPVGRQVHQRFATCSVESDPIAKSATRVRIVEDIDWVGPDRKTVLLKERRQLLIPQDPRLADRCLTWQAAFSTPDPHRDVTITGRDYLGLGVRFLQSMDTGGRFLNSRGETAVERVNGSTAPWCAFSAKTSTTNGQPVTLAVMDDPKNPRHPAHWFAMTQGFAYLSATLGLKSEPFVLKAGTRLVLRYGIAVWTGAPEPEKITRVYEQWSQSSTSESSQ